MDEGDKKYDDAILHYFVEKGDEAINSLKPATKIKIALDLGLFEKIIDNTTNEKSDREKFEKIIKFLKESASSLEKPNLRLLPSANTYREIVDIINSYLALSKKLNKHTVLAHFFVGKNLEWLKEEYKAGGIKNLTTWNDVAKEYCGLSEKVANGYLNLYNFYDDYKRLLFIAVRL